MGIQFSKTSVAIWVVVSICVILVLLNFASSESSPPSANVSGQPLALVQSKWPEIVTNLLIGLASAGAVVLGVVLSNRHSRDIMKEQREGEFADQERDRYLSYRKEVYFQVADDMGQLHGLFTRLGDTEFDEKDFSSSASRSMSGLHKLNLLAGQDTLTASHAAVVALSQCVSDVVILRLTIRILKSKIANANNQVLELTKLIDESFLEIKSEQSIEKRDLLLSAVNKRIKEQEDIIEAAEQLHVEQQGHVWELNARCMAHGVKLQGFINSLIIAMRLEIGVPVEKDRYVTESQEAGAVVLRTQMELAEKAQALVKEMINRPY